jgi:hypothetical protein
MSDVKITKRQSEIEKQFLNLKNKITKSKENLKDVLGEIEGWLLELGEHKLFLDPFNNNWMKYDSINDRWDNTGHKPGEVIFNLDKEKKLLIKKNKIKKIN